MVKLQWIILLYHKKVLLFDCIQVLPWRPLWFDWLCDETLISFLIIKQRVHQILLITIGVVTSFSLHLMLSDNIFKNLVNFFLNFQQCRLYPTHETKECKGRVQISDVNASNRRYDFPNQCGKLMLIFALVTKCCPGNHLSWCKSCRWDLCYVPQMRQWIQSNPIPPLPLSIWMTKHSWHLRAPSQLSFVFVSNIHL